MNWGYILIFLIEGFGSQTIGFASTYASTSCGEVGWGIFSNMNENVIPQSKANQFDLVIENTTLSLAEVDPLAQICFETTDDYKTALVNYGKAVTDASYLTLNLLYHAEELYLASEAIQEKLDEGFKDQDSEYYQTLGRKIGEAFFWAFYDYNDFEYPDITIEYPDDFDDEGLEFFQQ